MNTTLEEIKLSRALARAVYESLEEMPSSVKQAFADLQRLYNRQMEEGQS